MCINKRYSLWLLELMTKYCALQVLICFSFNKLSSLSNERQTWQTSKVWQKFVKFSKTLGVLYMYQNVIKITNKVI